MRKQILCGVLLAVSSCSDCRSALPSSMAGVTTHQVSSFDRSGGNADGSGYYLRRNPSGYVVLEVEGPGAIRRVWLTDRGPLQGNIRFYFDETVLDVPLVDFLESSGGYYSYNPVVFTKGIRVEFDTVPSYYQITYHRYSGTECCGPTVDIRIPPFNLETSKVLLDLDTCGAIESLEMGIPRDLDQIYIQMTWDNQDTPSVDIPLAYLFGTGGELPVQGATMGANPETHRYYNKFPMPFSSGATITLVNHGPSTIEGIDASFKIGGYCNGGRFTAIHSKEHPTTLGQDYVLADIQGTGHIVGVVLDVSDFTDKAVLEGDDRIYIDGKLELHGTGIEDFFNAGWYFNRGSFTLPTHGAQLQSNGHIIAYRIMLTDMISFDKGIRFTMEHGGINDLNADFESVVFLYLL